MFRKGANRRVITAGSVLWLLLLTLGLVIFDNLINNSSERGKNPVQAETIISQSSATILQGINIGDFQKTWIPNKDKFKLLDFAGVQFLENKNIDRRILHFQTIFRNTKEISVISNDCHLFPSERDDLPSVS